MSIKLKVKDDEREKILQGYKQSLQGSRAQKAAEQKYQNAISGDNKNSKILFRKVCERVLTLW